MAKSLAHLGSLSTPAALMRELSLSACMWSREVSSPFRLVNLVRSGPRALCTYRYFNTVIREDEGRVGRCELCCRHIWCFGGTDRSCS